MLTSPVRPIPLTFQFCLLLLKGLMQGDYGMPLSRRFLPLVIAWSIPPTLEEALRIRAWPSPLIPQEGSVSPGEPSLRIFQPGLLRSREPLAGGSGTPLL